MKYFKLFFLFFKIYVQIAFIPAPVAIAMYKLWIKAVSDRFVPKTIISSANMTLNPYPIPLQISCCIIQATSTTNFLPLDGLRGVLK